MSEGNGTSPNGLIRVEVGACRCPGAPHLEGDVVYLYPELGMEGGIAAQVALAMGTTLTGRVQGMYLALVDHAVADWTFVDGHGDKVEINPATVRGALPWLKGGAEVATKAIELYGDMAQAPLQPKPRKRKTPTPTGSS